MKTGIMSRHSYRVMLLSSHWLQSSSNLIKPMLNVARIVVVVFAVVAGEFAVMVGVCSSMKGDSQTKGFNNSVLFSQHPALSKAIQKYQLAVHKCVFFGKVCKYVHTIQVHYVGPQVQLFTL